MSTIDAEIPSDDDIQSVGSSIAESIGSEVHDEDDDLEEDLGYESGEEEAQSEEDVAYESGEEEAQSGPPVPTPASALGGQGGGSSLEVGMQVEALFDGGDDYFPGKITRKGLNGKFDVLYDDGDSEVDVPANRIRPVRRHTVSTIPEGSSSISVESSMQDDVEDIKSSIHSSGNEEYDDYDDDFEKSSSVMSSSLKMQPKTAKSAAVASLAPKKAVTDKIRAIGNQASPHEDLYAESSTESFHHLQKDNAEKQVEVMAQMLKQQNKQVHHLPTNSRVFFKSNV